MALPRQPSPTGRDGMRHASWLPFWARLLGVLAAVSLVARPLLPPDETRYLAVAWDMWVRGDFLVPHLNGVPYPDKPPLLFWCIQAGWAVFGLNEWWPRLVGPLFALGSLGLTARLGAVLWPESAGVARRAPVVLMGCLLWALFCTVTMFDLLLVFFTLAGLLGVALAWRWGGAGGWVLLGAALGLGLLAKGPVVLLHVLPAALAAPWWAGASTHTPRVRPGAWYVALGCALAAGVAVALAWALPAARAGGESYGQAIFWGEAMGYLGGGGSGRHTEAWWWYVALLPLILFPWMFWPSLWRSLARLRANPGVRVCLAWCLPALVLLSVVRAKQEQYLLPELPAFALLAARALGAAPFRPTRNLWPAGLALLAIGALLLLPALGIGTSRLPDWAGQVGPGAGLLVCAAALALLVVRPATLDGSLVALAFPSAWILVTALLLVAPTALPSADVRPVAQAVADYRHAGHPVAHVGKYRGELDFYGRLETPLALIEPPEVQAWAARNPDGMLVEEGHHRLGLHESVTPERSFPTGHRIFTAQAVAAAPAGSR